MRRRWLIILASLGAVVMAAVLLLPWWLGFALAHAGPHFGLSTAGYRRDGYGRFHVAHAVYRRGPVEVTVEQVNAPTPMVWLLRRAFGAPPPISAGRWSVEVLPAVPARASTTPSGWVPLRQRLRRIAAGLNQWIPAAELGGGVVTWKNGRLDFGPVHWAHRTISTPSLRYRALDAAVEAAFPIEDTIRVKVREEKRGLTATLRSEAERIAGEIGWEQQTAQVAAAFGATGWLPADASLQTGQWQVPAERLGLGQHYATVAGRARIEWGKAGLSAEATADGQPRKGDPSPPIAVQVKGEGREQAFVVETLTVKLPGITAALSDPVAIDREFRLRTAQSHFEFEAQLGQQPWFRGEGVLRGKGLIRPGKQGLASLAFELTGDRLKLAGIDVAEAAASGVFEWPMLDLGSVRLRSPDGREMHGSGGWDFRQRELRAAAIEGSLARTTLARWMPAYPRFTAVTLKASAAGVWPAIQHQGSLEIDGFAQPPLLPVTTVKAQWKGRQFVIERCSAEARMEHASVTAEGSVNADGLTIAHATLQPDGQQELQLTDPSVVRWRPRVSIGRLHFAGGDKALALSLDWGATGSAGVDVQQLDDAWLREFVALPRPHWTAESVHLNARWDRVPASYAGEARLSLPLGASRSAQVEVGIGGDANGLEIKALHIAEGSGPIVSATGRLPVTFQPMRQPFFVLREDGPFALDAETTRNPSFWASLTELTGLEIAEPQAQVHLKGSLAEPRGEALVQAERIAAQPGRFHWTLPRIEHVNVRFAGDRDGIRLDAFTVAIDGQEVRAEGWLPVAATSWAAVIRDPRRLVEHGGLRVRVPDADLAAIARYVPAYLAPTGRLQLDLTVRPDQTVDGFVRIRNAASRPLGPLGVLQDVQADVRCEGRSVRLQQVTARMGGQLVELRGRAELPTYATPHLDFSLTGQNLPFVRQAGLLVRGDLALTLKTQADGQNEIGGEVRLRDSLFVADLRSLLPSGAKGVALRPPYFAIEFPPLNAWRLAVQVRGEKFMRLRTPVFNGTASVHIRLDGTLGNPRATGDALIDDGTIRLPFASFDVHQGEVRLAPEQLEPQLMVTGTTRRYGYDLRLELTGPASSPNLTFTSSPPLEAEQVLLMVMAGQAPHNEVATTDRQRIARVGAYFGQSLLGTLSGGEGSDRLTISSGEDISQQGRETYSIEYRLSDRWALTGEYDQFDEYNGGIKWRIYQKGGNARTGK